MRSLRSLLTNRLSKGLQLQYYHLQAPSAADAKLRHVQHLLLVVQSEYLVYAAEIIVYLEPSLSTIYVSKVDSTGCHGSARTLISNTTIAFLQYLVGLYENKVRLTLFARSQPQYIFPCSSQNKNKHILDDKYLVKWWVKTYERLRLTLADCREAHGYVLIPGFEDIQTERYLPNTNCWANGHPYASDLCVVQQILSFPDDPKARFLDQLKIEKRLEDTTVASFWDQMAYRQEMSLGHTIGFITMDIQPRKSGSPIIDCEAIVIDSKSFRFILSTIQNETYSSLAECKAATGKLLRFLDGIPEVEAATIIGENLGKFEADTKSSSDSKRPGSKELVNVLQPRKKIKKIP